MSADGFVTKPDGWPAQLADPAFVPGESHGIREFLEGCEAALMGRVILELLASDRWPWPNLNVFVPASRRPAGTPDDVVIDHDPARLLEAMRAANQGGDVHLVGARERSRLTALSARSTSFTSSCCRCCSETACG